MKEELAKKFSIFDTQTIFVISFDTNGSFPKGFGIIYDSVQDALQHEPKHRLAQNGLKAHVDRSTKASTSREKKIHGIKSIPAKTH
jgi:ribosomal protein S24E